jgi:rubrerythrin
MIKVYESFNISQVGQAQSLLNAEGIETFLRNEFASSVMGEVPFVEVCPQLFILNAAEEERARELLQAFQHQPVAQDWHCKQCGMDVDGPFGVCWSCGSLRPVA